MLASNAPPVSVQPSATIGLWLWLIGVGAFALALRLPQVNESLWLDELHTAWAVSGGLAELPQRAAMGNNSPLYFLLPWATTRIFGLSEWALRLPSLLAGTALVPLLFWVVRRWTESTACGLLAAFLGAIDPNFVFFSLEARPYAVVQLLGLLQIFTFWRVLENPHWKNRTLWIVLSAALFYTHYTAILLLPGELAFLLLVQLIPHWRSDYRLGRMGFDLIMVAVLLLPAAWHLGEIFQRRDNWWLFVPVPRFIDGFNMLPPYALPVLVACSALGYAYFTGKRNTERQQTIYFLMLLTFAVLLWVVLIPYLTTRYGVAALWMRRYMMAASTAPILIAGLSCAVAENRLLRRTACVATAMIALLWTIPPWQWHAWKGVYPHSEENWRDAVALINADQPTRDWPVLVRSGLIEADGLIDSRDADLREYSLLPVRSIYSLDKDRLAIPLPASQPGRLHDKDLALLAEAEGVWLITPGGPKTSADTQRLVENALRRRGFDTREINVYRFGSVRVTEFAFKHRADQQ